MDIDAALAVIDEAIEAIDRHDAAYKRAMGDTGTDGFDVARSVEQAQVLPALELARQVAEAIGAETAAITAPGDKSMYRSHPFESNLAALVVLRTRLAQRERMANILGPVGPQLASSSFHPTVWDAAAHLFDDGHYVQAVQTAAMALEGMLQGIVGPNFSGQDLAKLFSGTGDGVRLHFGFLDPANPTYTSARDGAASLIRGAMMGVRNLVSHPAWPQPSADEALEMLAVLSYVAHLVDRAEVLAPDRRAIARRGPSPPKPA